MAAGAGSFCWGCRWPRGRADATPAAAPPFETVVRAERPSLGPLSTRLSTDDARTLPGVAGDAVRAVESLAGVTRPALGSGQLLVWGAAPAESRILIDGIELPALYHLGGLRTLVPTSLVQSLTLLPGGYGRRMDGRSGTFAASRAATARRNSW